jgi:hypothetical protein
VSHDGQDYRDPQSGWRRGINNGAIDWSAQRVVRLARPFLTASASASSAAFVCCRVDMFGVRAMMVAAPALRFGAASSLALPSRLAVPRVAALSPFASASLAPTTVALRPAIAVSTVDSKRHMGNGRIPCARAACH